MMYARRHGREIIDPSQFLHEDRELLVVTLMLLTDRMQRSCPPPSRASLRIDPSNRLASLLLKVL
jgi:hypothetical protein